MSYRMAFVVAAAPIVAGALACSGSVVTPVTSLPSTDLVASDAAQFCGDVVTYLSSLEPSFIPLVCAESGSGDTSTSECQSAYNACAAEANMVSASEFSAALGMQFMPDCETSISKCQGVTVEQASQCISDLGTELTTAASGITAESACSRKSSPFNSLTPPSSCQSLPSSCSLGASSSISVSSSGGTSSGSTSPDAGK